MEVRKTFFLNKKKCVVKISLVYFDHYPNHFVSIDNAIIKHLFCTLKTMIYPSLPPPSFKGRFEGSSSKPDFLRFTFTDARQTQATPSRR